MPHAPAGLHVATSHSPAVQVVHAPPPLPQSATVVPASQLPLRTHPVQQDPFKHSPPVHDVPSPRLVRPQLPEQVACWHSFPVGQLTQGTPLAPQAVMEVPPKQLLPDRHPVVQHAPPAHCPPGQLVPLLTGGLVHDPELQPSLVHGLLSLQLVHAEPPAPHCSTVGGETQLAPCKHPVQQLPPTHFPPGQLLPSATLL